MKKLFLLLLVAFCPFTIAQVVAQKKTVTTKTATDALGYKVINPGEEIILYKYSHMGHSPKEAEKYGPKYFFTSKSSDTLMDLSKANLKKAFSVNHTFHDALDTNFKEDKELISYDDFHKMYKLNWILQNSTK